MTVEESEKPSDSAVEQAWRVHLCVRSSKSMGMVLDVEVGMVFQHLASTQSWAFSPLATHMPRQRVALNNKPEKLLQSSTSRFEVISKDTNTYRQGIWLCKQASPLGCAHEISLFTAIIP